MNTIREVIKRLTIGFLSLFSARLDYLSILMYHSVSNSGAFFSVSPADFKKQMQYIHDSGFESIYASEVAKSVRDRRTANTVCITFDDGYEDVYTNAYPILKSLGMRVSVFLITSEIGGSYTNSEGRTFPLLNSGQIHEMQSSGLVEFLPHGHTHRKLHGLSTSEQKDEIFTSREIVEKLTGKEPKTFAYPRGRTTPEVVGILKHSRFESALGVVPGLVEHTSDIYDLPRNAVDSNVSFQEFKLKLSNRVRWYVAVSHLFQ